MIDLARELAELAEQDARFGHAADLAGQLERELARLSSETPTIRVRRRRPTARREARNARVSARLLEAFQAECDALDGLCKQMTELGISLSEQQLSDLRLGERTRRVLNEAGLQSVHDVAALEPERALDLPQLAPASIAEVRAALMFALEAAGTTRTPALPPPDQDGDLFAGLVAGVNLLPSREREALILRTGVEDRVHEVDEVARRLDCAPEQISQLETHALNTLLSQPACVESCWRLEEVCRQFGLAWDDERLPTVIGARFPNTRVHYTRLVSWLMRRKAMLAAEAAGRAFEPPTGIAHFEEMVVATLGRYGDLPGEELSTRVRAALGPRDIEWYPELEVAERVEVLGPAQRTSNGRFHLPDAPIPGVDDRHIRALNGLIGALQHLGSARISALTTEVNRRLPRAYQVNDQYVRAWLTKHPELFSQSDHDRFKLATMDVDILCGLATSWQPVETGASLATSAANRPSASVERMRERMAVEIEAFLRREGPQTVGRIRSHLYGRFIGQASADAVIGDYPERFVRQPDGRVALRAGEASDGAAPVIIDVPSPGAPPQPARKFFWQRR